MSKVMRHACGQLVRVDVFQSHGEVIPEFFEHRLGDHIEACPNCEQVLDLDWCGSPWLVDPMTETIAEHTVTNKFCASCWGAEFELIQAHDIAGNFTGLLVVCVHCREDTIGYVSDQYILRARSEDYIHYRRDAQAICKALGLQAPEFRTQAENLKALGF